MTVYNINNLIDKYFEGETTLDEEKKLKEYFSQQDSLIESKLLQYAPLFRYFEQEHKYEYEQKHQNEILELVVKPQPTDNTNITQKRNKRSVYIRYTAAAASLAILIAVGVKFSNLNNNNRSMAYIDGEKISNIETINNQAINALNNIEEVDEETMNSQIAILDSFID